MSAKSKCFVHTLVSKKGRVFSAVVGADDGPAAIVELSGIIANGSAGALMGRSSDSADTFGIIVLTKNCDEKELDQVGLVC